MLNKKDIYTVILKKFYIKKTILKFYKLFKVIYKLKESKNYKKNNLLVISKKTLFK